MKEYSYGVCPYKIKKDKVQILLIQPKGHLEWGFIKGKIDSDETIQNCVKRECKEETNIDIETEEINENQLKEYIEEVKMSKKIYYYIITCLVLVFALKAQI